MTVALIKLIQELIGDVKTITVDHGAEFDKYRTIDAQNNVKIYSPHPYTTHERGTNEVHNRIVHRFVPKGVLMENISNTDLTNMNWYIDSRPMKILNWQTPKKVFCDI